MSLPTLGRVGGELAEAFAWLSSPSRIDAEIRHLQGAIGGGDTSPATAALLSDWQAIRDKQRQLVGASGGAQRALDLAGATAPGGG